MLHQLLVSIKKPFIKMVPVATPECITGPGKLSKVINLCQRWQLTCPMIVVDPVIYRLGLIDNMLGALTDSNIEYSVFDGVEPDPDYPIVRAGVAHYRAERCDSIVAIGGGSAMDCAKAIGASVTCNKDVAKLTGLLKVHRKLMPIIAIPTTAGTGSECTVAAVVSDKEKQTKRSITDPSLVPKAAIIDPQIMLGLPPQITAETGADALTHAIESYLSQYANNYTRELSVKAIATVFQCLPTAVAQGDDLNAREQMALASYQAGLAFTRTYIGYVHAIAHQLGALYHVPHGRANAIVLPYVLRFYQSQQCQVLTKLAAELGFADSDAMLQRLDSLLQDIRLPRKVAELQRADIGQIAKLALAEAFGEYPVPVVMSQADCEQIVRALLL